MNGLCQHCVIHCNEVLKKGYTAKFSTIEQIFEAARMIEDASRYHIGTQCMGNTGLAANTTWTMWSRPEQMTGTVCMSVCRCRWTYLYAVFLDSWGVWIDLDSVEWIGMVYGMCFQRYGGLDLIPEVVGIY